MRPRFSLLSSAPEMPHARSARLRAAAARLVVDSVGAEVLTALASADVPYILVKGPCVVHWLYGEGALRQYVDIDVFVPPSDLAPARRALAELGFSPMLAEQDGFEVNPPHAQAWTRAGDPVSIDLHRALHGSNVPAEEAWSVLQEHTTSLPVGGVQVTALDRDATALLIALHAAQHGCDAPQAQTDLATALARFDRETWEAAARLAARLHATAPFAAALRLHPRGAALASELGLPEELPFEVALLALTPPRGTRVLHALLTTPGIRRKLALLLRRLVPPPGYMRYASRLARRGRPGLVAAYMLRPFVSASSLAPAIRALRQARRQSR